LPDFTLPKDSLITKGRQYNLVYKRGKRLRGKGITLVYLANKREENRLGISISGVRSAVRRNRLKRIIREFYRLNRSFPSRVYGGSADAGPKVDMVMAVRRDFSPDNLHDLRIYLDQLAFAPGRPR